MWSLVNVNHAFIRAAEIVWVACPIAAIPLRSVLRIEEVNHHERVVGF